MNEETFICRICGGIYDISQRASEDDVCMNCIASVGSDMDLDGEPFEMF